MMVTNAAESGSIIVDAEIGATKVTDTAALRETLTARRG